MKVTEAFNANAIALHYTHAVSNDKSYLGGGFFPNEKMVGLDLSWYTGYEGLPVALKSSTFDAKATFRDRLGIEKFETEMPFFREGMLIKEKDRQEIKRCENSNDPYAKQIISNIFNDAKRLIDGAEVTTERMRMQLLAPIGGTVGINIVSNGLDYTYNYDPNGKWKAEHYAKIETEADKWSNSETSKPLEDIKAALKAQETASGNRPEILLMNGNTFDMIANNESVRSGILAKNTMASIFYTDELVTEFVEKLFKIRIVVYDKQFKDETGATKKFYPDNIIMMLPNGAVGKTKYGTTPEELDAAEAGAEVSIVNTGVAVTTIAQPHPVNIETIVSEIVLPSFERLAECYALEVA